MVEVDFNGVLLHHVKLPFKIDNLIVQRNQVVFTTVGGELFRSKSVVSMEGVGVGQGFRIAEGNKLFGVRGNTVLCLNSNGNILCLEWGSDDGGL